MPRFAFYAIFITILGAISSASAQSSRPNVVLIITDDQTAGSVAGNMPQIQSRIFDQGITFSNAFATTPICTPSRASIMSGQYAARSGVRRNRDEITKQQLVKNLRAAGYYTGLVGKYSNVHAGEPVKNFDYWVSFAGGSSPYYNPRLNIQGKWRKEKGYISYLLRDRAIEFMNKARTQRPNDPFFLMLAPNAPHYKAKPAPGFEGVAQGVSIPTTPNRPEFDLSDKPQWLQKKSKSKSIHIPGDISQGYAAQIEALVSLDYALGDVLDYLDNNGLADNTVVLFISDNGLLFYQHFLKSKNSPYEEATKVPFAIRYPARFAAGSVEHRVVANIDIRPTIEELAGLPAANDVDGQSLLRLTDPNHTWREGVVIEGWPDERPKFVAYRTQQHKLIFTKKESFFELYDLNSDPFEINSLAQYPEAQPLVQDLMGKLLQIREP